MKAGFYKGRDRRAFPPYAALQRRVLGLRRNIEPLRTNGAELAEINAALAEIKAINKEIPALLIARSTSEHCQLADDDIALFREKTDALELHRNARID